MTIQDPAGHTIESNMISPAILTEKVDGDAEVDLDDLDLKRQLQIVERRVIERALARAQGNHSEAARLLGVTRNGLSMKIKRLGIERASE